MEEGNEPFGALLVVDGDIVLEATNSVVTDNDPLAHAELNLLRRARRQVSMVALARATLYAISEPCLLCAGDIVRTPIRHVVFSRSGDPEVTGTPVLRAASPRLLVEGPIPF